MPIASGNQNTLLGDRPIPYASRRSFIVTYPSIPTAPASPSHQIQPRATPSPACCTPNQVIIDLSTTILIQDYRRFYSTDINTFRPTYFSTADGSLITTALTDDIWSANLDLMLTGALAMLFIRNMAVAIDYLRRGKNRNKTLFYLLFVSQALAPASFVPSLLSFFNQYVNCTLVITMSSTIGSVALTLLLSGIIGIKTYKCMNDSKIIAGIIAVFALGHLAFVILDAIAMRGVRRIAGSCLRTSDLRYTRIAVALQLGGCCSMMLCFVYTCIKYRKTPGARGRISLRMSMEELPSDTLGDTDRVATLDETYLNGNEKPELLTTDNNHVPPRFSALRMSSMANMEDGRSHTRKSMASSSSRLSRLLSNMVSLKKVMRDELLYTCIVTVVITFALVFTFTGLNVKNGLSVTGWISLTWGLVSILVLHSFGRVVRRQERDQLMRYWFNGASIGGIPKQKFSRVNDISTSTHSPNVRSRRESRLSGTTNRLSNPFSETHQLRAGRQPSYQSGYSSSTTSSPSSPLEPMVAITNPNDSVVLPSLAHESTFPRSGGVEESLQELPHSWLYRRGSESQYSESS